MQIDITQEARDHLKSLAYSRGMTLSVFMLTAAAEAGDGKAKRLIADILKNKYQKRTEKLVSKETKKHTNKMTNQ